MKTVLTIATGIGALLAVGCGGYSSPSGGPSAGTVLSSSTHVQTTTGTPQSATAGTAFATALSATVTVSQTVSNGDGYGGSHIVTSPQAGSTVTFTIVAGAGGASGTFPGAQTTASAMTDASGIAAAPAITGNATTGTFTVTATVTGAGTPATFTLTNS